MATKINYLEYDIPLEVRYWRHPAQLAEVCELKNGSIYTNEVYTDGSKIGDNFGAAGIVFVNGKLVHQLKFKRYVHCSNNQAEQIAILKFLQKLEKLQDGQYNDERVAMYTDSKIALNLLQNKMKQNHLTKFITNQMNLLAHLKRTVHFGCVKGHSGIERNELVVRVANEAALYDNMQRQVIIMHSKENGIHMWQQQ